eukprot:1297376-Prorocentrum_lima.AAC.1
MTVLKRASELSQAFLAALQACKMLEAFSTAGGRCKATSVAFDDMDESVRLIRRIQVKRTWIFWKLQNKS